MKLIKSVFSYMIIFGSLSFTIITTIIGYQYQAHSQVYIVYNILIALAGYIYFLYHIVRKNKISISGFIGLLIVILLVITYLISKYVMGNNSEQAFDFLTYMLIWSFPAYLYGVIFTESDGMKIIWRMADIFMLIISLTVCINGIYYYINGRSSASVSGSTTYQTMSYLSALSIGINYYMLIDKDNDYRPKFFQSSAFYKIFCLALLIFQTLSLIITGGRGGMILAVVYFIVITLFKRQNVNKHMKWLVLIGSIVTMFILLFCADEEIIKGLNRIFEFVGDKGINWEGTSGRNIIYLHAIELISKKPLFGYGIWGLFKYTQNPHNIFLELLLGGGVCLLLVGLTIIAFTLKKFWLIQKIEKHSMLLFIFSLYNFVMLMFSGTYLCAPTLWFFVGFVFSYNIRIKNI